MWGYQQWVILCCCFMERVNQELEQYLRLFVSERQNDWADQYNNRVHSSTQKTPFSLDCGQHPRMGFELQPPSRLESANEFTDRMKLASEEAKAALTKAKDEMARYYNRRRLPTPTYHPGDLVYLVTFRPTDHPGSSPIAGWAHSRLTHRSPAMLTSSSYLFQWYAFIQSSMWSSLGLHQPTLPPPPELVEGEEYLVEKILDSKMFVGGSSSWPWTHHQFSKNFECTGKPVHISLEPCESGCQVGEQTICQYLKFWKFQVNQSRDEEGWEWVWWSERRALLTRYELVIQTHRKRVEQVAYVFPSSTLILMSRE